MLLVMVNVVWDCQSRVLILMVNVTDDCQCYWQWLIIGLKGQYKDTSVAIILKVGN